MKKLKPLTQLKVPAYGRLRPGVVVEDTGIDQVVIQIWVGPSIEMHRASRADVVSWVDPAFAKASSYKSFREHNRYVLEYRVGRDIFTEHFGTKVDLVDAAETVRSHGGIVLGVYRSSPSGRVISIKI